MKIDNLSELGTLYSGIMFCGAGWWKANVSFMLGRRIKKFPCIPTVFQWILFYSILSDAARGLMLISTIDTAEARFVHWDVINGSTCTCLLWASVAYFLFTVKIPRSVMRMLEKEYSRANDIAKVTSNSDDPELKGLLAVTGLDQVPTKVFK